MQAWENRPQEISSLLNPAFCGILLTIGIAEYTKKNAEGAPFAFPFIMLPLVLHKPSRQTFPRNVNTHFSNWITNAETAPAKVGFAKRARNLVPYVREALIFTMQNNSIQLTRTGALKSTESAEIIRKFYSGSTEEVSDCIKASQICGKWLAMAGDFKSVMALTGVRP